MKGKKSALFGAVFLGAIIISMSFVSAGFFGDLFSTDDSDLEGELGTESVDVTISMDNAAPVIESWEEPLVDSTPTYYGPTAGDSTTVSFIVTMYDDNGWDDLSDGVVSAKFSKSGETTRSGSCTAAGSGVGKNLEFTCNINMQFYDANANDWEINISATDGTDPATNDGKASDGSTEYPFFLYGSLMSIAVTDSQAPVTPATLEWASINAASFDEDASSDLIVQNQGNQDIDTTSTDSLNLTGTDLISATDPVTNTDVIEPDSFSVLPGTSSACDSGEANIGGAGQQLGTSPVDINQFIVSRGASETETLRFCLEDINPVSGAPVSSDDYKTDSGSQWDLTVVEGA